MRADLEYPEAKVVAEIGAVHIGSVDRAKKLINLAALAGADYVKFQKRNPIESTPKEIQNKPHPNKQFSYGNTYLEHRLALELSIDDHRKLQEYCDLADMGYATSVWDITSAKEIIQLQPYFIKVPSPCNHNRDLLQVLIDEYEGDIHISLGMTSEEERHDLLRWLGDRGVNNRIVLYHCTSEYPCPFEHLYLREVESLFRLTFEASDSYLGCQSVGFSNHGYGIAGDIAAYMLGAEWIERHFVDDRTFRHSDAAASLEPDGLRRLCRDLKAIRKTLRYKKEMSEEELEQRRKLRGIDD